MRAPQLSLFWALHLPECLDPRLRAKKLAHLFFREYLGIDMTGEELCLTDALSYDSKTIGLWIVTDPVEHGV
jgi:hypothetical protein